ncbi:hypothetical protein LBMAG42_51720 [Deltaproteobacteria bacterium]|nr:hypothetical protein LBMAG42_51720 [Deltaproteobacteria bacterium]
MLFLLACGIDTQLSTAATSPARCRPVAEVCNERDDDCDGLVDDEDDDVRRAPTWYADVDADGAGNPDWSVTQCTPPEGAVATADDCDDANAAVFPGAPEVCNGIDDDCDALIDGDDPDGEGLSTWFQDADCDGAGDPAAHVQACAQPEGTVATADDCDDVNAAVFPGAPEVCNGIDDDCDGLVDDADPGVVGTTTWYEDSDGDGYGSGAVSIVACEAPSGYVAGARDCDDSDSGLGPCPGDDDLSVCPTHTGTDDGLVPAWTGGCDETLGFFEYDGHCYFGVEYADSWGDARTSCLAAGGYLAVVTSSGEHAAVDALASRPWLGSCDDDVEGTWAWVTGEPWSYAPWAPREPNGGEGESCLEDYGVTDGWNDIPCDSNTFGQGYVCEFEP